MSVKSELTDTYVYNYLGFYKSLLWKYGNYMMLIYLILPYVKQLNKSKKKY